MIINSILDNDIYKFTMQQAIVALYPEAQVTYKFKNRGNQKFNVEMLEKLRVEIDKFKLLYLTTNEANYLLTLEFIKPWYFNFLKKYRFNPDEVNVKLTKDNDLDLTIKGPWKSTVLWEVPLMALISEIYFSMNKNIIGNRYDEISIGAIEYKADMKVRSIESSNIPFIEFGTRRRRSKVIQETVFKRLIKSKYCLGTSNVSLAKKYGLIPKGTVAHEWIMGISVLEGLRNANRFAMEKWYKFYNGQLGIALPDTFTTDIFLKDFNIRLSRIYDGVRWDSGDFCLFTEKILDHYKKYGIDPKTKKIIYSDGINSIHLVRMIADYARDKIPAALGIGTWFTNDFNTPALNIVIKLNSVDNTNVFKLSDTLGKVMGNKKAIKHGKYVFKNKLKGD